MTIITSFNELRELLEHFNFDDIGFEIINKKEPFIKYHKKNFLRPDLYAEMNTLNYEAEVYTWNEETGQKNTKMGTFNIRKPDEVLFLLTHCLNELKVNQKILNRYKREIGYDQTNVVPSRLTKKY